MPTHEDIEQAAIEIATRDDVDNDTLCRVIKWADDERRNSQRRDLDMAMVFAMGDMPSVPMTGHNKHTNVRYATLDDITKTARPVLKAHGLALTFDVECAADSVTVTAFITHGHGASKSASITLPFDRHKSRNDVQSMGSSITYGQRYTAQALLGISVAPDDDGQGAADGAKIDLSQVTDLRVAFEETDTDEAKFCAAMGAATIHDLPLRDFDRAMGLLKQKRERMNA